MQKLVKMMNGELSVNSTPGEGSVFEFTLTLGLAGLDPLCCPENSACCVKPEQQPPLEHAKLTGAKIILVDTHPVRQVQILF